jgi:thioredoxin 1
MINSTEFNIMQIDKTVKLNEKKYNFTTDEGVFVVNFYVNWSFYSKIQKLILTKFQNAIRNKVKVYNINADTDRTLIEKYNITAYPTILVFNNGEKVSHLTGMQDLETLLMTVNKILDYDQLSFS